ncbi:MAG: glycine--tRNA ligase subunit beta, partial [Verrucomicrobia bacterium]|nr:glycine--tRNA ligase subunit beta [Verrucomicrobiota bacterium]
IDGVRTASPDKQIREKVLPLSVALDKEGQPAAPLIKKLAALATQAGRDTIDIHELERASDGKADSFFFTYTAPGQTLSEGLQTTLEESITKLPIPKVMSYQKPDGTTVQFVRPVHGLMALLNETIIPLKLLGLESSNTTLGHRFLSKETSISIPTATRYANILQETGRVIASYTERKEKHACLTRPINRPTHLGQMPRQPAPGDAQDGDDGIDRHQQNPALFNVQAAGLLEEIRQPDQKKPPDGIGDQLGQDKGPRLRK